MFDNKNNNKVCPLMSAGLLSVNNRELAYCRGDECAIWHKERKQCGLIALIDR